MLTFSESQHFRQWWLWLLLIAIGVLHFNIIYQGLDNDITGSSEPVFILLVILTLIGLFLFLRLDTKIDETGIHYRFFPFQLKYRTKHWNEMEKVYVRKYKPIWEYGGWGIRGLGRDKALNVSGNMGLQLELKGGDKLLIGTQRPKEMEEVVLFYINKA